MTVAETLTVRIEADSAELERALKQIARDLDNALSEMDSAFAPLREQLDGIQKTTKKTAASVGIWEDIFANLNKVTFNTDAVLRDLKSAFDDLFIDAIVEGRKFSDVLRELEKDLAKIALRNFVAKPLSDAAGSLFGSLWGSVFGGPKAKGGQVSAGRAYLVGEQGPELFVPPAAGEIVPNNRVGGDTINLCQTISIAPDVSAVARAEIMRQLPMIRNFSAQGIPDARLRGALPA